MIFGYIFALFMGVCAGQDFVAHASAKEELEETQSPGLSLPSNLEEGVPSFLKNVVDQINEFYLKSSALVPISHELTEFNFWHDMDPMAVSFYNDADESVESITFKQICVNSTPTHHDFPAKRAEILSDSYQNDLHSLIGQRRQTWQQKLTDFRELEKRCREADEQKNTQEKARLSQEIGQSVESVYQAEQNHLYAEKVAQYLQSYVEQSDACLTTMMSTLHTVFATQDSELQKAASLACAAHLQNSPLLSQTPPPLYSVFPNFSFRKGFEHFFKTFYTHIYPFSQFDVISLRVQNIFCEQRFIYYIPVDHLTIEQRDTIKEWFKTPEVFPKVSDDMFPLLTLLVLRVEKRKISQETYLKFHIDGLGVLTHFLPNVIKDERFETATLKFSDTN